MNFVFWGVSAYFQGLKPAVSFREGSFQVCSADRTCQHETIPRGAWCLHNLRCCYCSRSSVGETSEGSGCLVYVPGSKLLVLGMVIQPLIGNPYNGYINPYYWVDDHPLLYGNKGSWSTLAHMVTFCVYVISFNKAQSHKPWPDSANCFFPNKKRPAFSHVLKDYIISISTYSSSKSLSLCLVQFTSR